MAWQAPDSLIEPPPQRAAGEPRRIAAPLRDPERFAPVFVLAPARSCSSVVATMIGQHPQLAGLPELKLFAAPSVAALDAPLPGYWHARGATHRSPGLIRALAQLELGDQEPAHIAQARRWLTARRHWSGADVLDVLLARLAPRAAVEKSPDNVLTDAALLRMAAAYPRARYLHLTRHPATTQASIAAHRRRTLPWVATDGEPMDGIAEWLVVHTRIANFLATLPAERSLRVRAEDALNRPRTALAAIARWLGLAADADAIAAMRRPQASPFARFGPAGVPGGHDHGFLRDPAPRRIALPRSIGKPRGWKGEARLWRLTVDLARSMGYGDGH